MSVRVCVCDEGDMACLLAQTHELTRVEGRDLFPSWEVRVWVYLFVCKCVMSVFVRLCVGTWEWGIYMLHAN